MGLNPVEKAALEAQRKKRPYELGYRVGEPEETKAFDIIKFEVEEMENIHLLTDVGNALGVAPTLEAIKEAIINQYGENAVGMWLCRDPTWARRRYGPGVPYKVEIPFDAIVISDLEEDGQLWIWRRKLPFSVV